MLFRPWAVAALAFVLALWLLHRYWTRYSPYLPPRLLDWCSRSPGRYWFVLAAVALAPAIVLGGLSHRPATRGAPPTTKEPSPPVPRAVVAAPYSRLPSASDPAPAPRAADLVILYERPTFDANPYVYVPEGRPGATHRVGSAISGTPRPLRTSPPGGRRPIALRYGPSVPGQTAILLRSSSWNNRARSARDVARRWIARVSPPAGARGAAAVHRVSGRLRHGARVCRPNAPRRDSVASFGAGARAPRTPGQLTHLPMLPAGTAGVLAAPLAGPAQPALEQLRFDPPQLCLRDTFRTRSFSHTPIRGDSLGLTGASLPGRSYWD